MLFMCFSSIFACFVIITLISRSMSNLSENNKAKLKSDDALCRSSSSSSDAIGSCMLPSIQNNLFSSAFNIPAPLFPNPIPNIVAPVPDFAGVKSKQLAEIFGEGTIMESQNQIQIENFVAMYCVCDQPQLSGGWMYPSPDLYSQFNSFGYPNNQYYEFNSENGLKQKEEMYYKLLENYKYEKLVTYDVDKAKEVVVLKCTYEDCDKVFSKPWNMLDHMHIHEGVKPHLCEWCGKTFTQRGNLK